MHTQKRDFASKDKYIIAVYPGVRSQIPLSLEAWPFRNRSSCLHRYSLPMLVRFWMRAGLLSFSARATAKPGR